MTTLSLVARYLLTTIFIALSAIIPLSVQAQLPQPNTIYINFGPVVSGGSISGATDTMMNYNPALPVSATNPSLNSIHLPPNAAGLAISPVLGSGNSTLTYYTVVNLHFWYYDSATGVWVDTGDSTGTTSTVNIGAGGGYIYAMQPLGGFPSVYRYDGTGDATYLAGGFFSPRPYDLAVDCEGNYYIVTVIGPMWSMIKRDHTGALVQTYTVNNPNLYNFSGGLAIIGSDIYADDILTAGIAHGTIAGNTVNFTNISPTIPFTQQGHSMGDFASFPFDASGVFPTLTITASDTVICNGAVVHFASNASVNGGQFQWQVNGASVANATQDTFSYIPQDNDIITCTMTANGGCSGVTVISLPITIHVQPTPAASFTLPSKACLGDTIIAVADTPLNITYQWDFAGAAVINGSGPGPYELVWNTAGNHTVNLQAGQGSCAVHSSKSILISNPPALHLSTENNIVCVGDTVNIEAIIDNNTQLEWLAGNNYTIVNIAANEADVVPTKASTIIVKATNSDGCSTTQSIDLAIAEHCCALSMPNAFSPNSDGLNDVFQPVGRHYNIESFQVFNRWGQLIYNGYNQNTGWNGDYKGKPEDAGSYFYEIRYRCLESNNTLTRKGDVTLVR